MNITKSIALSKQPKYKLFIEWFIKNGGKFSEDDIVFPAVFQPGSYVGIASGNHIKKHKVILAIPQSMIISLTKVRNSVLSQIFQKNDIFNDEQDPDTEFNILALYIIHEKMKGKQSFYHPYLNCLDIPETILNWNKQQIIKIGDPYIKQYALQLKQQYEALFQKFLKVVLTNKKLFPEKLTYQLFLQSYAIVTTRSFGWGLPQTFLIPFADYFNHDTGGIYHYMCNLKYQKGQEKLHKDYILKNMYLDLTLFGIPSKQYKKYEPNERVKFIKSQKPDILQAEIIQNQKSLLQQIHRKLLIDKPLTTPLIMSEDEEDNDSDQEEYNVLNQPNYANLLKKQKPVFTSKQILKEKRFQLPKLPVNKEFQEQIEWGWWKFDDKQTYFIVATSSPTKKHDQLFNSYGKRSNRFLLIWYGFTLQENKYNSVPFRLWMWKGQNLKTKSLIFERRIGDSQWDQGIILDNQIFPIDMLTKQFRLKQSSLSQQLIVYLRLHIINTNPSYLEIYTNQSTNLKINNPSQLKFQIQVFTLMQNLVKQLSKIYDTATIEQDYALLKNQKLSGKQLFTLRMRVSNKRIILIQQAIIGMVLQILNDLSNKISFEQAYRTTRLQYENDKLFRNKQGPIFYRKKIIEYLRSLYPIL